MLLTRRCSTPSISFFDTDESNILNFDSDIYQRLLLSLSLKNYQCKIRAGRTLLIFTRFVGNRNVTSRNPVIGKPLGG